MKKISALLLFVYLFPIGIPILKAQEIILPTLLITEIAAFQETGYEWLEIYNSTDNVFDVSTIYFYEDETKHRINLVGSDTMLESHSYGVIVQDPAKFLEIYPLYAGKIFDSSWSTLKEDGEEIGLMLKEDETFLEKFTYIPAPENSLQRKTFDPDFSSQNWQENTPSPGQENIFPELPQEASPPALETVESAPNDSQSGTDAPSDGATAPTNSPISQNPEPQAPPSETSYQISYGTGYAAASPPEPPSPKLLINEVSFKDPVEDFAELLMIDDKNNGAGADISYFAVETDSPHFSFPSGKKMKTGEFFVVKIPAPGFTGTTEQLIVKDARGRVIDALCWYASKIPDSEKTDMENLFFAENWGSPNPESCLPSEKIKSGQSIGRTSSFDTNSAEDFEIFLHPTKGLPNAIQNKPPKAVMEIQSGEIEKIAPLSINLDGSKSSDPEKDPLEFLWDFGDGTMETTKNPKIHTYHAPGTYEIRLRVTDVYDASHVATLIIHVLEENENDVATIIENNDENGYDDDQNLNESIDEEGNFLETSVLSTSKDLKKKSKKKSKGKIPFKNGDLSSRLLITELLPNPEGQDAEDEWIEIFNPEKFPVNLGNYQLDDSEGGSKPFVIPDTFTVPPQGYLVFMREDTKIALNNSKDEARLFDFNGKLAAKTSYQKTYEGKSYALLLSPKNGGSNFEWVDTVTPGAKNPRFSVISGTVKKKSPDLQTLVLADAEGHSFTVSLGQAIDKDLANTALPEEASVEMEVMQNPDGTYTLRKLHDVELPENTVLPPQEKEIPKVWWLYGALGISLLIHGILLWKRRELLVGSSLG